MTYKTLKRRIVRILDSFPQYGEIAADEVEEVISELRCAADDLESFVDSPRFDEDDEDDGDDI
jgi:hypothetical protein